MAIAARTNSLDGRALFPGHAMCLSGPNFYWTPKMRYCAEYAAAGKAPASDKFPLQIKHLARRFARHGIPGYRCYQASLRVCELRGQNFGVTRMRW